MRGTAPSRRTTRALPGLAAAVALAAFAAAGEPEWHSIAVPGAWEKSGLPGTAGHDGHAVSLVAAEEHELLRAIERLIGHPLPRQAVPGFEPTVLSAPPLDLSGGRGRGGRGGGAPGRVGSGARGPARTAGSRSLSRGR